MREYSMKHGDVMDLPLRTFWSLNRNVDRLRAEEDLRSLQVSAAAQSVGEGGGEAVKFLSEHLRGEIGSPIVIEKKFDRARFKELADKLQKPRVAPEKHAEGSE
jgi:uncharacterized protein YdaU (DUF1376 family)